MDINFELYKVFYYVASTLSFSEASSRLFISQSAVSQSIKVLEEKMGCKLLFRSTKQVRLTHEGEVLFKSVEQAYNFLKAGERNISEMHSMLKGEVRIGASDTICKYYLLSYFKRFKQLYPGINIRVTNRTSPVCLELLQKGVVDFSIVNLPSMNNISDNLKIREMRPIQDVFIAGNGYRKLEGKDISIKELKNYPLLMLERDTSTRKCFDDFAQKLNMSFTPEIESSSVDLLVELARIGMGISYVMYDCIEKQIPSDDLFIVKLKEKIPQRKLGMAVHKDIPLSAAGEKFIELLLNDAGPK